MDSKTLEQNKRINELREIYKEFKIEDKVFGGLELYIRELLDKILNNNEYIEVKNTVKDVFTFNKTFYRNSLTMFVKKEYLNERQIRSDICTIGWYCELNKSGETFEVSINIYNSSNYETKTFVHKFNLKKTISVENYLWGLFTSKKVNLNVILTKMKEFENEILEQINISIRNKQII